MDPLTLIPILAAATVLAVVSIVSDSPRGLPDHDLANLLPSRTSTGWKSALVCSECHSEISHNEFMTDVCLTCGSRMRNPKHTAIRSVTRRGKWVRHQGVGDGLLEVRKGIWLPPSQYDEVVSKCGAGR